jgi:hypothetical protein
VIPAAATAGSLRFILSLEESLTSMLTKTPTADAVSVSGFHLAHGYTRQPIGVKALAAADLVVGHTRLADPLPAQAARLVTVPVYHVKQALQIVHNDELRAEVIAETKSLWAAAQAVNPTKPLRLSTLTPLEEAIAKASQLELELACVRFQSRLWSAFEKSTATPLAA